MKKKSVRKNYFYNLIYQLFVLILPIVTTPYVSRILGAKNIGIYGYTLSISAYFVLFGVLGTNLYGQREIAYYQKDKKKYTKIFYEILLLKLIVMALAMGVFYITFAKGSGGYSLFYKILMLELFANGIDVSWFFQGLEDFKKTSIRNFIVKIISIILIFVLVKEKSDLNLYFIIYVLSILVGNLSLWISLPKYLDKLNFKELKIFNHFLPTFIMFVPQAAIQVYTVLDRTMIGKIIHDKTEVGYYTQAEKIVKLLLTIVSSLGIVMLPRLASKFAAGDNEGIKKYIYKSFRFTSLLSFPIIMGIVACSDYFVPVFFGEGYDRVSIVMKMLCPIILFIGVSGIIGYQYFLATKHQKEYTASVIIGSIINFIINIIMIPKYGAVGAAIGTIAAEFSVAFVQIILTWKFLNYKRIILDNLTYVIGSGIMYIGCISVNRYIHYTNMTNLIIIVSTGVIIYGFYLIIIRDSFVFEVINKILRKVRKQ